MQQLGKAPRHLRDLGSRFSFQLLSKGCIYDFLQVSLHDLPCNPALSPPHKLCIFWCEEEVRGTLRPEGAQVEWAPRIGATFAVCNPSSASKQLNLFRKVKAEKGQSMLVGGACACTAVSKLRMSGGSILAAW